MNLINSDFINSNETNIHKIDTIPASVYLTPSFKPSINVHAINTGGTSTNTTQPNHKINAIITHPPTNQLKHSLNHTKSFQSL